MEIIIPDGDGQKVIDILARYAGPYYNAAANVIEQISEKIPIEITFNRDEAEHLALILDCTKTDNWKLTGKLIDKVAAKL